MSAILIEPHLDDAVLFATYTLLRYRPDVITVLAGPPGTRATDYYGTPYSRRRTEQRQALDLVGCVRWFSMQHPETRPDWGLVHEQLRHIRAHRDEDIRVFAPRWEDGGHEQHNLIAEIVNGLWENVTWYMTYRRGHSRSHGEVEVQPAAGERARKLLAMSCYSSQIDNEATRWWFASDHMLREWWYE